MSRKALTLVWACSLAQGMFYASTMPIWEGFDEFSHLAFIEDLSTHGRLPPLRGAVISRDIGEAMRLTPVPWMIRTWQPDWISYDAFWRLPEAERAARLARLRSIPLSYMREPDPASIRDYETQQPPLAYLVLWAPWWLARGADIAFRVWLLRMICVVIASAVPVLTFLAVREALNDERVAVAGAALAASFPEFYFDTARVSNDALSVVLGAALVWLLVSNGVTRRRNGIAIGILLGCALLTKAYFLPVFVAAVCIIAARSRSWKQTALCAVIPAAIAGWWYARAYALTGSIFGEQTAATAMKSGGLAAAALHTSWLRVADFVFMSHVWLGGWSFLVVRTWMYRMVEILFVIAIAMLLIQIPRMKAGVWIAIWLELAFCAGLAMYSVASVMSGGAGAFGFYAYAILPAEVICLVAGCRICAAALSTALSAIGLFGMFIYAMPYWTGITWHDASGMLHAIPAAQIVPSLPVEFPHLAWGKPVSASVPAALLVLFVIACAANCAVCWRAVLRKRRL